MPENYQPGFTYSACWPFTKNKERIKKFKETQKEIQSKCEEKDLMAKEQSRQPSP